MPGDDVGEHRIEFVAYKLYIPGIGKVRADGLEKPKRGVDCVVFRYFPRIRETVLQHSLIHMFGESAQNAARNVMLPGGQSEARQRDHGVPPPVAEPVIAGNDRFLISARNDVLVSRRGKSLRERVV